MTGLETALTVMALIVLAGVVVAVCEYRPANVLRDTPERRWQDIRRDRSREWD